MSPLQAPAAYPIERVRAAFPALTVSDALSSRTPCRAQWSRQPCEGGGTPRSVSNSLKMFCSEGGGWTPRRTEKQSPWA
jgi:hypothetical protein